MNKGKKAKVFLPVHHYPSRKEWVDACWQKIVASSDLLESLVTPYERRNLVIRAAARERIRAGSSYRQIADELWLSPQTISSAKKAIRAPYYQSYRERGKIERKKRVYSRTASPKRRPRGKPVRTKYGTVYVP